MEKALDRRCDLKARDTPAHAILQEGNKYTDLILLPLFYSLFILPRAKYNQKP